MENILNEHKYCFYTEKLADIQKIYPVKEKEYLVFDLITKGLNVFAGPAKSGKSWLMLQLADSVGGGIHYGYRPSFLEKVVNTPSYDTNKVLYFSLTVNQGQMAYRIKKQFITEPALSNILVSYSTGTSIMGFFRDLDVFLQRNNDIQLVVIDTFPAIFSKFEQGDEQKYIQYLGNLKVIAEKYDISIVCIVDTHKMIPKTNTVLDIVYGEQIAKVADNILLLNRNEELYVIRNAVQYKYALAFNNSDCRWHLCGY